MDISIRIHGYMDTWIHEYMDTWMHGYLDIWIFEYLDILNTGHLPIKVRGGGAGDFVVWHRVGLVNRREQRVTK